MQNKRQEELSLLNKKQKRVKIIKGKTFVKRPNAKRSPQKNNIHVFESKTERDSQ